jgi:hypothetical protein
MRGVAKINACSEAMAQGGGIAALRESLQPLEATRVYTLGSSEARWGGPRTTTLRSKGTMQRQPDAQLAATVHTLGDAHLLGYVGFAGVDQAWRPGRMLGRISPPMHIH